MDVLFLKMTVVNYSERVWNRLNADIAITIAGGWASNAIATLRKSGIHLREKNW